MTINLLRFKGHGGAQGRTLPLRPMIPDDEWSGSPDPDDPDNFWIDDETGERVNAITGERKKTRERMLRGSFNDRLPREVAQEKEE